MCTPDSTFRNAMNLALLNLQEAGELREMKLSWWKQRHGGGACKVSHTQHTRLACNFIMALALFTLARGSRRKTAAAKNSRLNHKSPLAELRV